MAGWTAINSLDAPVSNIFDFQSMDLTTYEAVQVALSEITLASDAEKVYMTVYVAGTVVATYRYSLFGISATLTRDGESHSDDAQVTLNKVADSSWHVSSDAGVTFNALITMFRPGISGLIKLFMFDAEYSNTVPNEIHAFGGGAFMTTGIINGIRIHGSVNLAAGKVAILGLVP